MGMRTLTPAQNGLLKGLLIVVLAALASYFSDAANLTPLVGNSIATLVAMVASAVESHIRDKSGQGLFGAVGVR